jgi:hypothetical protein
MVDSILRITRAISLAPTLKIVSRVAAVSYRTGSSHFLFAFIRTVQIDAAAAADITRQRTDTWYLQQDGPIPTWWGGSQGEY